MAGIFAGLNDRELTVALHQRLLSSDAEAANFGRGSNWCWSQAELLFLNFTPGGGAEIKHRRVQSAGASRLSSHPQAHIGLTRGESTDVDRTGSNTSLASGLSRRHLSTKHRWRPGGPTAQRRWSAEADQALECGRQP